MSGSVSTDLESLIQFRTHLKAFNRTLGEEFSSIRAHWQSLGDVWTDAKYQELGEALAEVQQGIDRYLAATEDHETHLLGLIEAIRAYGDLRLRG